MPIQPLSSGSTLPLSTVSSSRREVPTEGVATPKGEGMFEASRFVNARKPLVVLAGAADTDPASEGQREKALRMTRQCEKKTVGAAIEPLLSSATGWVGNLASGKVGDLYEKNKELLCSPATDANIEKWAKLETDFFKESGGAAGFVGGFLSAEGRAQYIKDSARAQGAPAQ